MYSAGKYRKSFSRSIYYRCSYNSTYSRFYKKRLAGDSNENIKFWKHSMLFIGFLTDDSYWVLIFFVFVIALHPTASMQQNKDEDNEGDSETAEETHNSQQESSTATKEEVIPTKIGPNLSRLWSYDCTATKSLSVTCLVWNKHNPVP